MISNIVKDRKYGSYELVVAISCIEKLLRKFHNFILIVNHNPFKPAKKKIRKYQICVAEKKEFEVKYLPMLQKQSGENER